MFIVYHIICIYFIFIYIYLIIYTRISKFFKRVTTRGRFYALPTLAGFKFFLKSTNLLIENFHLIHIVKVLVCVNILCLLLKMQKIRSDVIWPQLENGIALQLLIDNVLLLIKGVQNTI